MHCRQVLPSHLNLEHCELSWRNLQRHTSCHLCRRLSPVPCRKLLSIWFSSTSSLSEWDLLPSRVPLPSSVPTGLLLPNWVSCHDHLPPSLLLSYKWHRLLLEMHQWHLLLPRHHYTNPVPSGLIWQQQSSEQQYDC
jgi:hypothetical protein